MTNSALWIFIFLFFYFQENHFSQGGLGKTTDYVVSLVNSKPSPESSDADIDYGYDYYEGVEPLH